MNRFENSAFYTFTVASLFQTEFPTCWYFLVPILTVYFFGTYIASIKNQLLFLIFNWSSYISLSAFLPLSLSGMCVFVGSWRISLWKWLCYIVFIAPHNMLPLWEFLLTLRLSIISQNALCFALLIVSGLSPYILLLNTLQKLVTSLTINCIFILKELFLTCAIASSDRTWLPIGSHNLSPSDMFTYCWATSSSAVRLAEIYRKKNISC